MKPIFNKNGLENLLEQIRIDNPTAIITSEQIMSVSVPTVDQSGRSNATLVASVDQGYSGEVAVSWIRNKLTKYITDGAFIKVNENDTEVDIKERIGSTFDLVLSDLQYQGFAIPELTQNQAVVFTLSSTEGLVYPDSESVSVLISVVTIDENVRGNGNLIRITDTGLVRGIVAGSTPPVGTDIWFFPMSELYGGPEYANRGKYYPDVNNPLIATTTFVPVGGGGSTPIPYEPVFFEQGTVAGTYTQDSDPVNGIGGSRIVHLLLRPAVERIHIGLNVIYGPVVVGSGSLQDFPMSEWYISGVKFQLWPSQNDTVRFQATSSAPNGIDEIEHFTTDLPTSQNTISFNIQSLDTQTGECTIAYSAPGGNNGTITVPATPGLTYYRLPDPAWGEDTVDCTGEYATIIRIDKSYFWETQPVTFNIVDTTSAEVGVPYKDAQYYTYTPVTHKYVYGAGVSFSPKSTPELIYLELSIDTTKLAPDRQQSGVGGFMAANYLPWEQVGTDSFYQLTIAGLTDPSYEPDNVVIIESGDNTYPIPYQRSTRGIERVGILVDQVANTYTVICVNDDNLDDGSLTSSHLMTHTLTYGSVMDILFLIDVYGKPSVSSDPAYPDVKAFFVDNGPSNSFFKTIVEPTLAAKIESAVPLSTVTQNCSAVSTDRG